MTDLYPYLVIGAWVGSAMFLAYLLGYRRGRKNEYHRGFIAARLKYEIPRNSRGRFVKRNDD